MKLNIIIHTHYQIHNIPLTTKSTAAQQNTPAPLSLPFCHTPASIWSACSISVYFGCRLIPYFIKLLYIWPMNKCFQTEINLLCVGDVLSGKSSFLENYTKCLPENLHYKIYPQIHTPHRKVYFHEVEQRYGMDAYFSYPFDAVLYFLNINDYHNPQYSIIEQLAQISKLSGINIFKMPLKVMVIPSKNLPYLSIRQSDKQNLKKQLSGMVDSSMIVFIEEDESYLEQLSRFYDSIQNNEARGIAENLYVNWQLKGILGLFQTDSLIFSLKKMSAGAKKMWHDLHLIGSSKSKEMLLKEY